MVGDRALYVEGGGNSKNEKMALRQGIAKLLEKAGFGGKQPRIWACGGRQQAFRDFQIAIANKKICDGFILLVDSEEPVQTNDFGLDSPAGCMHLKANDGWKKPKGIANSQVALMATCMETWFSTDRTALKAVFGDKLKESALPALNNMEMRSRQDLLRALESATISCGNDKRYVKGERSYKILHHLDPAILKQHLPQFRRFLEVLNRHLR
jgi:hypothetical protein